MIISLSLLRLVYLYNNYFQEIINGSDISSYNISFYSPYNYKNKKCILYSNNILGLNPTYEPSESLEDLIISENTPQILNLNSNKSFLLYKYLTIDKDKDIIINIRFINFIFDL